MGIREMLLAMAIFGTIGIVRRYIPFPSSVIAFARGIIGTGFLLAVQLIARKKFSSQAWKKNWHLLLISGAMIGLNWVLLFEAYRYTTVSIATMCYYMAPVLVILISPFILKEKLSIAKGICAVAAVVGMTFVSGVFAEGGVAGNSAKGILFGLGAACLYAGVVILNKFIKDMAAGERTLFQLGAAALAVLPYVLLTEDISGLEFSVSIVLLLLVAGIVHTGIAYTLYFGSMKNLPAPTVAMLSYVDPVVAVILSVVILRESMSLQTAVGVVIVLGSMFIGEFV